MPSLFWLYKYGSWPDDDCSEGIRVDTHIIPTGSDFTEAHGLEELITHKKNAIQNGQTLAPERVAEILTAANQTDAASADERGSLIMGASYIMITASISKNGSGTISAHSYAVNNDGSFSMNYRHENSIRYP